MVTEFESKLGFNPGNIRITGCWCYGRQDSKVDCHTFITASLQSVRLTLSLLLNIVMTYGSMHVLQVPAAQEFVADVAGGSPSGVWTRCIAKQMGP